MKKLLALFVGLLAIGCNLGSSDCSCEAGCCEDGNCTTEGCACACK